MTEAHPSEEERCQCHGNDLNPRCPVHGNHPSNIEPENNWPENMGYGHGGEKVYI